MQNCSFPTISIPGILTMRLHITGKGCKLDSSWPVWPYEGLNKASWVSSEGITHRQFRSSGQDVW